MTPTEEYLQRFPGEFINDKDRRMLAFRVALEMRNFEIELYWKRATYFWTFLALTFGGYGAAISKSHLAAFAVANMGLFFSTTFWLVHRGSKFWQENWENHVAVLGDETLGALFSQILRRDKHRPLIHKLAGPAAFSVSRINEFISMYLVLVWISCAVYASPVRERVPVVLSVHPFLWITCGTIIVLGLSIVLSRTTLKAHRPYVQELKTELS